MSILKPKNKQNINENQEVNPVAEEATENNTQANEPATQAVVSQKIENVFTPKTEAAANLILEKFNDIIRDLKVEIAKSEPRYADLDTYVEALKSDLINVVILKNHFKKQY